MASRAAGIDAVHRTQVWYRRVAPATSSRMALLRTIQRSLLRRAFSPVAVDDFRTWTGATTMLVAWHLAREVERRSRARNVGILLPTSGMFAPAMLGTWMAGRTAVPLNYLLSRSDLEYIAKDAGLDAVIAVGPMLDLIGGPLPGLEVIRLDALSFKGIPPVRLGPSAAPDDTQVILYTSGTSGRPKGVMLSERNLSSNVRQVVRWARFDHRDVMLGVLPQFHSFGLTVLTLLPLCAGCRVVYTARFIPSKLLDLAQSHRPSVFVAIPSMYNALLHVKSGGAESFRGLRYAVSGGEPLPDKVSSGFHERYGVRINEGYGLTETSPVTNWCLPEGFRPHSVGQALPEVEERIVDPEGRVLGPNQDGEVRIKGPNVMKGYYNLPELTASVFDEHGFFRTGDMGRFDADGHLFITGRIKEMLIISGENVFPREIEEVVNHHPLVKDSAVVGLQDPSRGEVPICFVELKDGVAWDEHAVRAFTRERLPPYKVPREFRVVEALPRNPTGKIMRRALVERLKQEG
jgi:long-chain acyl-CoA synthetase